MRSTRDFHQRSPLPQTFRGPLPELSRPPGKSCHSRRTCRKPSWRVIPYCSATACRSCNSASLTASRISGGTASVGGDSACSCRLVRGVAVATGVTLSALPVYASVTVRSPSGLSSWTINSSRHSRATIWIGIWADGHFDCHIDVRLPKQREFRVPMAGVGVDYKGVRGT